MAKADVGKMKGKAELISELEAQKKRLEVMESIFADQASHLKDPEDPDHLNKT